MEEYQNTHNNNTGHIWQYITNDTVSSQRVRTGQEWEKPTFTRHDKGRWPLSGSWPRPQHGAGVGPPPSRLSWFCPVQNVSSSLKHLFSFLSLILFQKEGLKILWDPTSPIRDEKWRWKSVKIWTLKWKIHDQNSTLFERKEEKHIYIKLEKWEWHLATGKWLQRARIFCPCPDNNVMRRDKAADPLDCWLWLRWSSCDPV